MAKATSKWQYGKCHHTLPLFTLFTHNTHVRHNKHNTHDWPLDDLDGYEDEN